jgi:protein TonB
MAAENRKVMDPRRVKQVDVLFVLLLAASAVGHLALRWLVIADEIPPRLIDLQRGRNTIDIQLIATAAPQFEPPDPNPLAVFEPVEVTTPEISSDEIPQQPREHVPEAKPLTGAAPELTETTTLHEPMRSQPPPETPRPDVPNPAAPQRTRKPPQRTVDLPPSDVEIPKSVASLASSGEDVPPNFLSRPLPAYPEHLLIDGVEGVVRLLVTINRDGRVGAAAVHSSSGYSAMDDSALETVRSWQFTPARRHGLPIEKQVVIPIRFRIRRG